MPRYGNWHAKSHKKPFIIPVSSKAEVGMPAEWLQQAKEMHKEFGREGLLKFFRASEKRDGTAPGALDILLPLFGEKE